MTKELVSIIIPVHNRADLICETLSSIRGQTYPYIEVIVVDDHSIDNTVDMVRKFGFTNRMSICVIESEGYGACAARNTGLKESHGEFVQFFDDDDIMDVNFIMHKVEAIIETKSDFATCNMSYFNGVVENVIGEKRIDNFDHTIASQLLNLAFPAPAFLVRKSVADKMGLWDVRTKRFQDLAFFSRLFKVEAKGVWLPDSLIFVRVHDKQISSRNNPNSVYNCIETLEIVKEEWRHRAEYQQIKKIVAYHEMIIIKKLLKMVSIKYSIKAIINLCINNLSSMCYVLCKVVKLRSSKLTVLDF